MTTPINGSFTLVPNLPPPQMPITGVIVPPPTGGTGSVNPPGVAPTNEWRQEVFNQSIDFSGSAVVSTIQPVNGGLDFTYLASFFSERFVGFFSFDNTTYTFTATADDGVRVFVNNVAVIDEWRQQSPTTFTANVVMPAGFNLIRVEYFNALSFASLAGQTSGRLKVSWAPLNLQSPNTGSQDLLSFLKIDPDFNQAIAVQYIRNSGIPLPTFPYRFTNLSTSILMSVRLQSADGVLFFPAASVGSSATIGPSDALGSGVLAFTIPPLGTIPVTVGFNQSFLDSFPEGTNVTNIVITVDSATNNVVNPPTNDTGVVQVTTPPIVAQISPGGIISL